MVDVALQGVWVLYPFNKDEDDGSPPLLAFQRHVVNAIFLKYQVQTEYWRIQNTFKHLRWSAIE